MPRTADKNVPGRRPKRLPAYREHACSYSWNTRVFQTYRRSIVDALPLSAGDVVLDVGCGTGLCCGLLQEKVGARGGVVGIEESPEMLAVARQNAARAGWRNVSLVESSAEDARLAERADAALFCAVHDILQSPEALQNIVGSLRPGAWVAAGGGKWAPRLMLAANAYIRHQHAPYVRSFDGFDRPWRHLERLTEDVRVREVGFGGGYLMTGRVPPRAAPPVRSGGRSGQAAGTMTGADSPASTGTTTGSAGASPATRAPRKSVMTGAT
jgi:demethylmenaquinone methyltransferase/2-methoxy-6-polyprenyl-1,4-benzoquinol methylase